jgi:hypothetical protein
MGRPRTRYPASELPAICGVVQGQAPGSCPPGAFSSPDPGKIECWHQTLKNRVLLENYYLPGDLEAKVGDFVAHYNHLRYHESIANLAPADVHFGRGQTILLQRERINAIHSEPDACISAAKPPNIIQQMRQILSSITHPTVSNYLTADRLAGKLDEYAEFQMNQGFVEQLVLEANMPGKRAPNMYVGCMMMGHRGGKLSEQ